MPAAIPLLEVERRGAVREQILAILRDSLRDLPDPETGQPYSEDEIRQATMRGSRYWVEAEALDIVVSRMQTRAEVLAEQVDPRRSMTSYLENYHGPAAKLPRLEDDGATGVVTCEASPGAVFVGSANIPEELAVRAQGPNGLLFQVLFTTTTPSTGHVRLVVKGIDGGVDTRLVAGDKLQWINPPPGAGEATVVDDFAGGTSLETDAEWGERLFDAKGSRALAGNAAHFRLWARSGSSSVDKAYVYPNALGAGTVLVAVTQKRAGLEGPTARVPTVALMSVLVGFLTPPGSPVVPGQARVVVVPVRPQPLVGSIRLGLRQGGPSGWNDLDPWPRLVDAAAVVLDTPAPTQTAFRVRADTVPPTTGVPQLMAWDPARARFERLSVVSVTRTTLDGDEYDVVLSQEPELAVAAGVRVSPLAGRHASITKGIVRYFDELGPGELVAETDFRFAECHRRPAGDVQEPAPAGERIVSFISQAIGGSLERGSVHGFSPESPSVPVYSASQGPYLLVPQHLAVYPV